MEYAQMGRKQNEAEEKERKMEKIETYPAGCC